MQINCVESFERCTATVHCASSLFTNAEGGETSTVQYTYVPCVW